MDKEYLEAVDRVCLDCAFGDDDTCMACPVRRTMDLAKIDSRESVLIDYILKNIHSCPFSDKSGMDFNNCSGFGRGGCKECIHMNTDKLLK